MFFDGSVRHSVSPNDTDNNRVTVAINFNPEYDEERKEFIKKYQQAGQVADYLGKDRYFANKWERKAENWANQEYNRKWKNKF